MFLEVITSDYPRIIQQKKSKYKKRIRIRGVYKVECLITGHTYVGVTDDLVKRLCEHRAQLRNGRHPIKEMQGDFTRYGEDNFAFLVLHELKNRLVAQSTEAWLIQYHQKQGTSYNVVCNDKWD